MPATMHTSRMRSLPAVVVVVLVASPGYAQKVDPAARAAVIKAQEQQATRRSYSVLNTTASVEHGHKASAMLAYVAPDRYHSVDLDGRAQTQVIKIGKTGWMRFRDEPWQPEIVDSSSVLRWFRSPTPIDHPDHTLVDARVLGPAELRKKKTLTYQYVVTRFDERLQVKLWVDAATGLPMRYEAEVKKPTGTDRVSWDYEYEDNLTIERPVK